MLLVNLYGGPGSGKSTLALMIGAAIKASGSGVSVEVPNEIPKYFALERNHRALQNQLYVAGMQWWQIARCEGEVDVVVCDSPILLSAVYGRQYGQHVPDCFIETCRHYNSQFEAINVFVERQGTVIYEEAARVQTSDEAVRIDDLILQELESAEVSQVLHMTSVWDNARLLASIVVEAVKASRHG